MQEADTDDHQGTLGFEEFCAFYKMMSTRRDLYLLMLTYSDHKDHLGAADLQRFLEVEQKMTGVTLESCQDIIAQFEPCPENKRKGVLGIDGEGVSPRSRCAGAAWTGPPVSRAEPGVGPDPGLSHPAPTPPQASRTTRGARPGTSSTRATTPCTRT